MSENIAKALVEFQATVPKITRSKTVKVRTKQGGMYEFDYAPHEVILETIRATLAEFGLSVQQPLHTEFLPEGRTVQMIRTILRHESGEKDESSFALPITEGMSAQEIGSAITYMRRYALSAMLGLATEEDDDGNHASGNDANVTRVEIPKAVIPKTGPAESSPSVSEDSGADDNAPISDAQLRKCEAFAEKHGWESWEKAALTYGYDSNGRRLTVGQARDVFEWIGRRAKAEATA